jgi:AcrR family transcriptional regulator
MGISERRERERDEIRTRILNAARTLFAQDGYDAVTMRKIAEAIEYSPTAIYSYFSDKDALIRELCDTDFLSLAHAFAEARVIADPIERLRAIGSAYVDFALAYPQHYQLMFMTPQKKCEEHGLEKGNPEQDAYAVLVQTVQEAIDAQLFRPGVVDAHLIGQVFWSGVHGVISLHVAKGNDDWIVWRPLKETATAGIDAMLFGLLRTD